MEAFQIINLNTNISNINSIRAWDKMTIIFTKKERKKRKIMID